MPALGANSDTLDVMGGEGYEAELDLVREGRITAVNIFPSEWVGWAAIDTMNSVFRKEPPVDSGLGWVMADAKHNLPASGAFDPPIDYQAQYRKAWAQLTPDDGRRGTRCASISGSRRRSPARGRCDDVSFDRAPR